MILKTQKTELNCRVIKYLGDLTTSKDNVTFGLGGEIQITLGALFLLDVKGVINKKSRLCLKEKI